MGLARIAVGAVVLLAANACAPLVVQQSARTVKPGQMAAGMSVGAVNFQGEDEEFDEKSSETYTGVVPNGFVRFGLASKMDAGLQFYGGGVRAFWCAT